ncbi:MAG: helix-hairpin-helix domain-containing protein [Desulfosarcina sp.]|nr:helix-hairpin-helix domain-containing protein [Desulfosarcina sp.]MBC2764931.1 helix-hairpin-helix domain-containing protein [Desulfosarcina sp.]
MARLRKKFYFAVIISIAVIFTGTCFASSIEKVNINTAPIEQLMDLDRVGAKYAERIIEYREKNGPFKNPEDIMNVKGIGQKTWEANKDRIVV